MAKRTTGSPLDSSGLDIYDQADEKVLKRMQYHVGDWERMKWYVDFANLDLSEFSEGTLLTTQEEIRALRRTLTHHPDMPLPDLKSVRDLQQQLSGHLMELVEMGTTKIGPFQKTYEVSIPTVMDSQTGELSDFLREHFAEPKTSSRSDTKRETRFKHILSRQNWDDWLLDHMARLLEKFAGSLRKCPHCSNLFLQLRRSAAYCGRKCQSVAIMQKIRAKGESKSKPRKGKSKSVGKKALSDQRKPKAPARSVRHGKKSG